ncbi:Hypothetical protein A7982_11747 [Minicystis rosea]|nr:Hypothetical protein A7982_11747 [Minicystis rosea]
MRGSGVAGCNDDDRWTTIGDGGRRPRARRRGPRSGQQKPMLAITGLVLVNCM